LPLALGKEAILNNMTVAIAANLGCLIRRFKPTLNFAENALLNFLSPTSTVTSPGPQKSVHVSEIL
jgi:hypothetical protein